MPAIYDRTKEDAEGPGSGMAEALFRDETGMDQPTPERENGQDAEDPLRGCVLDSLGLVRADADSHDDDAGLVCRKRSLKRNHAANARIDWPDLVFRCGDVQLEGPEMEYVARDRKGLVSSGCGLDGPKNWMDDRHAIAHLTVGVSGERA